MVSIYPQRELNFQSSSSPYTRSQRPHYQQIQCLCSNCLEQRHYFANLPSSYHVNHQLRQQIPSVHKNLNNNNNNRQIYFLQSQLKQRQFHLANKFKNHSRPTVPNNLLQTTYMKKNRKKFGLATAPTTAVKGYNDLLNFKGSKINNENPMPIVYNITPNYYNYSIHLKN